MMERPHIPELYLEMIVVNELSQDKRKELSETHGETEIQEQLAALKESNSELLERYPAADFARMVKMRAALASPVERIGRQRAPAGTNGRGGFRGALSAAGNRLVVRQLVPRLSAGIAMAALLLMVGVYVINQSSPIGGGDRVKGAVPGLLIYKQTNGGVELLHEGDIVKARDTLQISYVSAGQHYGVILSIDGRGGITVHLPESSQQSAQLEQGQVALHFAYRLDDAPKFERFFFVTSDKPFSVAQVENQAKNLVDAHNAGSSKLSLPRGMEQSSLLLMKGGD